PSRRPSIRPGSSTPTCCCPSRRGKRSAMHDWGIAEGYHDIAGRWIDVPADTKAAIRQAMGEGEVPPGTTPHDDPVAAFRPGQAPDGMTAGGPWELHTEDGAVVALDRGAGVPPDLPLGYHR